MSKEITPLEALERIGSVCNIKDTNYYKTVETALKALEIIDNKNVDTLRIKITPNVTRYNKKKIYGCKNLIKEDYDILKEALND